MKKNILLAPLLFLAVGCQFADGLLYSSAKSQSITHVNQSYLGSQVITKTPENDAIVASSHGEIGAKAGESTKYHVLGFSFGGGTVAEAALSGQIQQITTVERQRRAMLWPFFWTSRTVVTGKGPTPVVQVQPGDFKINPGVIHRPLIPNLPNIPPAPRAVP